MAASPVSENSILQATDNLSGLTGPRGRKDGKLFRGPSTFPNTSLRGKVRPCWLKGERVSVGRRMGI